MLLRAVLIAIPVIAIPSACIATEFEKSGLPCVAEVCLGDGLGELGKVQWNRAQNPDLPIGRAPHFTSTQKLRAEELKMVQSQFRGDVVQAAPYLYENSFDGNALPALSRVVAVCSLNPFLGPKGELIGAYTTQNGNPTRVAIALIPSQTDTSKQRWTVVRITRSFPSAISDEQQSEVREQLAERYKAFDIRKTRNAKSGEGRFSMNPGSHFTLHLFRGIDEANRRILHPACGGTVKVKID